MNPPQSERPVELPRPVRRSIAELAAILASDAVVEKLPLRQPIAGALRGAAMTANEDAATEPKRRRQRMIDGPANNAPDVVTARVLMNNGRSGARPDQEHTSQQLDDATLAAARSARHYRRSMLENLKVHIIAAANDRNGVAPENSAAALSSRAAGQPRGQEQDNLQPHLEPPLLAPADNANDPCAKVDCAMDFLDKARELINVNLNAGLEYARLLANARSPVELVELSINHARQHFELIIKHTAALAALSRSMMSTQD